MGNQGVKSPLKEQPMRLAGQSTREKLDRFFEDEIMPYIVAVIATMLMAFFEWWRVIFKLSPQPVLMTILFVIAMLFLVRKVRKTKQFFRQLRLGADGELSVGQMLDEKLRPVGCQIFNDILAADFNVDHFVIGPTGLFCIETKTHSKPQRGECRITYDGASVSVNGFTPDRDPVIQAKAEARWMSDLIEQSTGKRFSVQPVVVYPGWYIETTRPNPDVWVLNDTVVPTYIKNARGSLSPEDVSLVAFHLKRYVIAKEK